eukprot:RCo003605
MCAPSPSSTSQAGSKITFSFSTFFGAKVSNAVELSFTYTRTMSKTFTDSTTQAVTSTFTAAVPPLSSMTANVIVYHQAAANVAFTANRYQLMRRSDGTSTRILMGSTTGVFSGVDAYRATAEWQKPIPLTA